MFQRSPISSIMLRPNPCHNAVDKPGFLVPAPKVGVEDLTWNLVERHLHQFSWQSSGSGMFQKMMMLSMSLLSLFNNLKTWRFGGLAVPMLLTSLTAFAKDTLLDPRWLLDGVCKTTSGLWHEVMTMTESGQSCLLARVVVFKDVFSFRVDQLMGVSNTNQGCKATPFHEESATRTWHSGTSGRTSLSEQDEG